MKFILAVFLHYLTLIGVIAGIIINAYLKNPLWISGWLIPVALILVMTTIKTDVKDNKKDIEINYEI